jgi:hypothetical protein
MLALRVSVNGKRVCTAGADDLTVLSAIVSAVGKLGKKTASKKPDDAIADIFYSVGGLTAREDPKKDVHVRWKSTVPLRIGDVIEVKILEAEKVDRAKKRA